MEAQQPLDMMDRMVAARYAPLVLPQPLNALQEGIIRNICQGSMGKEKQLLKSIGIPFLAM